MMRQSLPNINRSWHRRRFADRLRASEPVRTKCRAMRAPDRRSSREAFAATGAARVGRPAMPHRQRPATSRRRSHAFLSPRPAAAMPDSIRANDGFESEQHQHIGKTLGFDAADDPFARHAAHFHSAKRTTRPRERPANFAAARPNSTAARRTPKRPGQQSPNPSHGRKRQKPRQSSRMSNKRPDGRRPC